MINNSVLMIISSKFDHAELIGNYYSGIYAKIKKKCLRISPPPLFLKIAYKIHLYNK